MRRLLATVLLAALAIAAALPDALAYLKAGPPMAGPGHHRLKVPGGAPLDGFTQPTGAYSFRKLISGYSGAAIRIRRASDNAELDINFLGCTGFTGCPWDEAAAVAHCVSTTCFVRTWYSHAGTLDLVQATAGNQPQLIFNCNGSLPCVQFTATVQVLASAGTVTPATGVVSFSVVANRAAGTVICGWLRENAALNRIQSSNIANTWQIASTGNVSRAATDNVWHAAQGVIAGASSVLNVDGGETTGTATGSVAAGTTQITGATGSTCNAAEAAFWDNYIRTPAERTVLAANQKSFYATP